MCLERDGSLEQLPRPIVALAWSPDGVLLAQRGSGKILFCPHPASFDSSAPIFLFGAMPGCATALACSPSGKLLASADSSGQLCIWGMAYGAQLASVTSAHAGGVGALCFVGDELVRDTLVD